MPIAFHFRIFPQSINNNEPEINEKNKKRYYLEYKLITRDTKFQLGAHYLKKIFFSNAFLSESNFIHQNVLITYTHHFSFGAGKT